MASNNMVIASMVRVHVRRAFFVLTRTERLAAKKQPAARISACVGRYGTLSRGHGVRVSILLHGHAIKKFRST